jgi:hypothetical protein
MTGTVAPKDAGFNEIVESLKKAASTLKKADLPFMLGGSVAYWARGAADPPRDLDLVVRPEHAEPALETLTRAGMRPERPPEDWLLKAWDGDVLIDLIFNPRGVEIGDEAFARSDSLNVCSIEMPVMAVEDVLTSKLLALTEHALDYEPLLQVARSLREQIRWEDVMARTRSSPYARAFFALLRELGIMRGPVHVEHEGAHVRVLPAS